MKKWLILGLFWCSALLHGAMLEADKEITMGILPNGMKYYIQENPYPAKTGLFYLRVDSGSSDERDDELGLAHLVEHMAFNGSRDFSKNDLIRNLESFGVLFGADLNAYTTYDSTAYHLKVAIDPKNLDNTFRIFHNWMDGVSFEAEELEKERGVVMAEERTRNTPQYRLFIQRMKQLVAGSIYENRAPIGDMEIIKNVSAKKIKSFYERIYQPRFMSFVAVGDFDKNEIERRIKETFAQVKNTNDYQHPDKTIPVKSGMQLYNYDTSELGIDSVQIAFCDSFRAQKDEESVRETLLNSYITILINQIYQKKNALIKAKFTARPLQYQQMIYSFDANVLQDDFKNSLGDVWGVLEGIRRFGFNQNHFEDAKKTLLGIVRMAYEQSRKRNSENLSKNIIEHIDSDATLLSPLAFRDLRLKLLDEITPKEVNERFRHILNLPAKSISLYSQKGIKLSAQEWKQIQSTATVFNTQESDKILPQSLISTPITPKKILKKELDKKSQITVLTLENGAKVILKPLKMTSSTVLFSAFSPGGTSVLENPRLGSFSVTLPNESGVGDFNAYEMAKIISGKPISYSRFIEPLSHGLRGKSSASDLETLLQAIHLEFSAPRTDPKTLEQIKTKTIE
ncbi:MAG: insulinase family protein, partial [Wolinella sp.]